MKSDINSMNGNRVNDVTCDFWVKFTFGLGMTIAIGGLIMFTLPIIWGMT